MSTSVEYLNKIIESNFVACTIVNIVKMYREYSPDDTIVETPMVDHILHQYKQHMLKGNKLYYNDYMTKLPINISTCDHICMRICMHIISELEHYLNTSLGEGKDSINLGFEFHEVIEQMKDSVPSVWRHILKTRTILMLRVELMKLYLDVMYPTECITNLPDLP